MSNPYAREQFPPEFERPPRASPFAVAGFILSLFSIILCIAAPFGLVLSLLGLRREPRGLAIIGTMISGFVTFAMLAVVIWFGPTVARLLLFSHGLELGEKARPALTAAREQILVAMGPDGDYPTDAEGNAILAGQNDFWGTQVRYERTADGFEIRSAGPDKRYSTWDDITKDNVGGVLERDDPHVERRYQAWKKKQQAWEEQQQQAAQPTDESDVWGEDEP